MDTTIKINYKHLSVALVITIILTISCLFLMFAAIFVLNDVLEVFIGDPWYLYHQGYQNTEETYRNLVSVLKPIGYLCFFLVLGLITIGIFLRRYKISLLGSYALYLPILGQFSVAMVALFAGIGVTRIIWVPIYNIEPELLNLAAVILLPIGISNVLVELGIGGIALPRLGYMLTIYSMLFLTILGGFIFVFGMVTWVYGKSQKRTILNFWIYRYSRHPQYLGLILFNYSLFWRSFIGFTIHPSLPTLPWLVVTFLLLGLAITEENNMIQKNMEEYTTFRSKTPFLIPLPRVLTSVILLPTRLVLKKDWPDNNRELVTILIVYGLILILSSLPFMTGLMREMDYYYSILLS